MSNYRITTDDETVDNGAFEEMLELASELAAEVGGMVVLHRKYCLEQEIRDDCSCNPLIVRPYTEINEEDLEGLAN